MVALNTPAGDAPLGQGFSTGDAPAGPAERPVSDRKRAANRAHARKSTGPKTEQGKAVSRLNGIKHGVHSEFSILPGEDPLDLEALARELHYDLRPQGMMQRILVSRIVSAAWKLRRIAQGEAQAGDNMVADVEYGNANRHLWGRREPYADITPGRAMCRGTARDEELGRFIQLELKLQRGMDQSLKMLLKLQEQEREAQEEGKIEPPGRSIREEPEAHREPIEQNEPTADNHEPPAMEPLATAADAAIQQTEATEPGTAPPNPAPERASISVWAEIDRMNRQNQATESPPIAARTRVIPREPKATEEYRE